MEAKLTVLQLEEDCRCDKCNLRFVLLGKRVGPFILPVLKKNGCWIMPCPRHAPKTMWQHVFETGGVWPEGEN